MNEVLSPGPYLGFLCYLYFTLGPLYYFLKKSFNYFIILMRLWYQFKDKDNSENISKLNFPKFQAFHLIAVIARTQTQKYQETLDLRRCQKSKAVCCQNQTLRMWN